MVTRPLSLAAEEVQQVAAGTAAALPGNRGNPPTLTGERQADQ
jgi:hypothetical protein